MLLRYHGISIRAYVSQVGKVAMSGLWQGHDPALIDANPVRCPDPATAKRMETLIRNVRKAGDTIGGAITCEVRGCPAGLGEPVFDKLHADLAKAIVSINACKGFEIGSGFSSIGMFGSEHNDVFFSESEKIQTLTNHSGGVQGGISNGMDIWFRAAFKPVATIMRPQRSVDAEGREVVVEGKGRHDPCVVPRAVPIVEAMAALVLADHLLRMRLSKL
jgi:chorismate synthase